MRSGFGTGAKRLETWDFNV